MDWNNYFKEQISKSSNHPLNKVNDFTGNQTGGFIRPFGNFLMKQNIKFNKWLFPEKYDQAVERYQREIEGADDEGKKKILEKRKKLAEIFGEEQEGGFLGRYNPMYLLNNAIFKDTYDSKNNLK